MILRKEEEWPKLDQKSKIMGHWLLFLGLFFFVVVLLAITNFVDDFLALREWPNAMHYVWEEGEEEEGVEYYVLNIPNGMAKRNTNSEGKGSVKCPEKTEIF